MIELWTGDVDCVVFLQTIEHVQDPDAVLDHIRELIGPTRRRLRLDAERAHARPEGRRALGQPVARARVPRGRVPGAVRAPLRLGRPARPVPRAQAARPPVGARARRLGRRARAARDHPGVLRPLHAGHLHARLRAPALGASTARSTSWRCCAHEPALDRPAHAHALRRGLRDVAVRRGVAVGGDRHQLPAAARRARRPPRPGHAVADAGAVRPARGAGRARALPGLPARDPARVAPARHRGGGRRRSAAALERSAAAYAAAADALERRGDLLAAFAPHATLDLGRHPPVLPLLATGTGVRLQLRTGIASHRERFGEWDGGFWLPECAHAPWLDDMLEEAGVRVACVDWTDVLGPGPQAPRRTEAGVVLAPLDREAIELVWHRDGYPVAGAVPRHAPADRAPPPRVGDRRRRLRRRPRGRPGGGRRRGLRARAWPRAAGRRWWRSTPSCSATSGPRASTGCAPCSRRASAAGSSSTPPGEGAPRTRPADPPVTSWGDGRDLRTWSGPAAGGLAWTQRGAELRAFSGRARPSDRALRELLALQSSDWAFLISAGTAGDYPRERAEGHRAAFEAALADPAMSRDLRHLAPLL